MPKLSWFPFFAADWLSSSKIAAMTTEQEGAYLRLLIYQWTSPDCAIPDNERALSTMCKIEQDRWEEFSDPIRACFEKNADGKWHNPRLTEIRLAQEKTYEKRAQAGARGGHSKALAMLQPGSSPATARLWPTPPDIERDIDIDSSSKNRKRKTPQPPKGGGPEQSTIASGPTPLELQGLGLYETDHKLVERFPELLREWTSTYPGISVRFEIKKAHAWEVSNPKRRKTNKVAFLNNWLSRAQDQASRTVRGTPFVPTTEDPDRTACAQCGGTGEVADGVKDGVIIRVPCRRCTLTVAGEPETQKRVGNLISETMGKIFRQADHD